MVSLKVDQLDYVCTSGVRVVGHAWAIDESPFLTFPHLMGDQPTFRMSLELGKVDSHPLDRVGPMDSDKYDRKLFRHGDGSASDEEILDGNAAA
ncbi:MAG: hypothetical protein ABS82_00570 [Rhodanobacter sp. SCN 67-45]|nr:MAG: hypothetical protein ABS82_00570 [Rhodanobacter sp. SCN 67-45]